MELQTEIKQAIDTSIFLDDLRKKRLLEILKIATPQEQEKLLEILKSEKSTIGKIIRQYIAREGEKAIESLNLVISKGQRKTLVATEKKEKTAEDAKVEDLLKQLDQI